MMLCASLAGIGFGSAGVHIPHACAYPIATGTHAYQPAGLPGRPPVRPPRALRDRHLARRLPLHLRGRARAPHPRRRAAAAGRSPPARRARHAPGASCRSSCATSAPRAACASSATREDDIPGLVQGALKQQRLLVLAPREPSATDLERIMRESLENW